jgi:hypothetical protein
MVRRLFELAKSPNIHEAEAAMMKAQELLHKYNLSEGAVPTEAKQPFIREWVRLKNQASWAGTLLNTVARYNGGRVVWDGGEKAHALIGQRHVVEIVLYGYAQMEAKIRWLADVAWDIEEDRMTTEARYKEGYSLGAVTALSKKLQENKQRYEVQDTKESMALVVKYDADLTLALAGFYPRLTQRRGPQVDGSGFGAGARAGRFLNVDAGLNGGGQGMRRLNG